MNTDPQQATALGRDRLLVVNQPEAWLIQTAGKRDLLLSQDIVYRGPVVVSSGIGFNGALAEQYAKEYGITLPATSRYRTSEVFAVADIVDCQAVQDGQYRITLDKVAMIQSFRWESDKEGIRSLSEAQQALMQSRSLKSAEAVATGRRIAQRRAAIGYSVNACAAIAQMTPEALMRCEQGKAKGYLLDHLQGLVFALAASPEWILHGEGEPLALAEPMAAASKLRNICEPLKTSPKRLLLNAKLESPRASRLNYIVLPEDMSLAEAVIKHCDLLPSLLTDDIYYASVIDDLRESRGKKRKKSLWPFSKGPVILRPLPVLNEPVGHENAASPVTLSSIQLNWSRITGALSSKENGRDSSISAHPASNIHDRMTDSTYNSTCEPRSQTAKPEESNSLVSERERLNLSRKDIATHLGISILSVLEAEEEPSRLSAELRERWRDYLDSQAAQKRFNALTNDGEGEANAQ